MLLQTGHRPLLSRGSAPIPSLRVARVNRSLHPRNPESFPGVGRLRSATSSGRSAGRPWLPEALRVQVAPALGAALRVTVGMRLARAYARRRCRSPSADLRARLVRADDEAPVAQLLPDDRLRERAAHDRELVAEVAVERVRNQSGILTVANPRASVRTTPS